MDIIIYFIMFLMGIFFGSFYTLAVYRIPLREDIVSKHSFCPNCKHKLGILDLIPVLSYIFLKGKCRYCGEKIRIRYLLLEILTGIVFVFVAISFNINLKNIELYKLVCLGLTFLYITALFIIAGIDKEKRNIQKSVLTYGFIISAIYIIYLYILGKINMYRYAIYLLIMLILVITDIYITRKNAKSNYTVDILMLCLMQILFTGEEVFVLTVIFTLITIAGTLILNKVKNNHKYVKKDEDTQKDIPIGIGLCASNVIALIIYNFITFCR